MPAELTEILSHAEKLGQMLVDQPAITKYKAAQKSVMDDADARNTMNDFNRMIESLARQEQQGMSITDAQRLSLEALQTKLASNIKVKALNMAQVDFMDTLRKISEAWQKPINALMGEGAAPAGPRVAGPK